VVKAGALTPYLEEKLMLGMIVFKDDGVMSTPPELSMVDLRGCARESEEKMYEQVVPHLRLYPIVESKEFMTINIMRKYF